MAAGLAETPEDIASVTSHFVEPDSRAWFARDVWRISDDAGGPAGAASPDVFAMVRIV